ncbi:hypothetical protein PAPPERLAPAPP_00940 [Brevundimonas phage vB_BpoS-Papperlapapp]|uniref:Uncharacterized protein n=2 Tax=Marchewkavirus TaxID=3425052 RepID=A0A9E7MQL0_9CAUD|nr:hypothetical protein KABACHOK_05170 [Brevundimonas phage vB_BpoS-Kabachok]USN15022.1 hypothetical protein DOMOVOI_05720 [Brevundimonas phage vB_BpoS-Domovoi]USN15836.1 hypothetical protein PAPPERLAPAPP_00940 [Brevundimonas phage vB_BpoS-Papperlapapp]
MPRLILPAALFAVATLAVVAFDGHGFALPKPPAESYSLVQYVIEGGEVHAYVDDYGMSAQDCLNAAQASDDLRCEAEGAAS